MMIIRKYRESDINRITELGKNLHDNYKFDLDVFSSCMICEQNDGIIGFITYSIIYDRAEIVDAYIDARYRRKKYGSRLLEKIIDECKKRNCNNITLEVNQLNQPALDFYYKYGFKIVANKTHYYNNGRDDAYVMELEMK
ncbi:MAG: ribosomal protein S18-alanine N-acetyltransferase [Bacilli bacterium]|nr:ribosomal protein S18-alanine N-acetyltransferase [Bacilli bacterium]